MKKDRTASRDDQQASYDVDGIAAAFDAHYLDYQYIFVEFLIGHMTDAVRAFEGDYLEMLVLAVLGQSRLAAVRKSLSPDMSVLDVEAAAESTNASRIADITGIPRQTVRRKLATLVARGWVVRDAAGAYRIASVEGVSHVRRELSEPDRRAMYRIARLFVDLGEIVERQKKNIEKSR